MAEIRTVTVAGITYDIPDDNTTYSPVESGSSTPGLMTGSDKAKLDNMSNITAGVTDISAGTTPLVSGDVYLVYEE